MRQLLIFLTICVLSFDISAQEIPKNPNAFDLDGNKTGVWTILYDLDWNVIESIDSAKFYRVISYERGTPSGKVVDHYLNGEKQWEGYLISDDPELIKDGKCIWYNEGIQEYVINYKNNIQHGDYIFFNTKGEECFRIHYRNGIPDIQTFDISKFDIRVISFLDDLSSSFEEYGDMIKAIELKKNEIDIIKQYYGSDNEEYGVAAGELGRLYSIMNKHSEALKMKLESLRIYEKFKDTSGYNYGITLDNLAITYSNLGNNEMALKFQLQAIELIERGLGKEHRSYGVVMNNIAMTYYRLAHNYDKNNSLYIYYMQKNISYNQSSLELRNKDSIDYASSLDNLSISYSEIGEYSLALENSKKAVDIYRDLLGRKHKDYSTAISNLSLRYNDIGDHIKSLELQKEVLEINKEIYGEEGYYHINIPIFNNIFRTYFNLNDFDNSLKYLFKTNKALQHQYLNNERSLNSRLIQSSYDDLLENFQHIIYILFVLNDEYNMSEPYKLIFDNHIRNHSEDIYNTFILLKGRELSNSNAINSFIFKSNNDRLISLYQKWLTVYKKISFCYEISRNKRDSLGLNINELTHKKDNLERDLINLSAFFKNTLRDYSYETIKSNLSEDEIYVDILNIYGDRYYAYITKKGDKSPQLINLGSASDFDDINNYYSNYTKERPSNKEFSKGSIVLGNICYQNLWSKIEPYTEGVSTVYFSPEGVYSKINLNVLYDSTSSSFLMDKYDIVYVSNVEDFVHQQENIKLYDRPDNLNAVLIGNPTFLLDKDEVLLASNESQSRSINQDELDSLQRGMLLSDLPGTQTEVDLISDNLKSKSWDVEVISGIDATETRVKSIEAPKIFHIATHGFFFDDQEMVKLSNIISTDIANSMTRSGLIFSGAENTMNGEMLAGDNGWLNSSEVSLLNLRGTELVVLSACETGTGDVQNGKGVYGLQRAIRIAGAESLIMSMWEVDDKATQELMTYFYDFWIDKKMTKKDAFNKAQRKIREKYKHPYYWGAFIMLGE